MTGLAEAQATRTSRHGGALALGAVLMIVGSALALSIDVPRTAYGIKGDEATYVAAALSAAFDHDLSFERRDLERFAGLYHSGPEGIFLKRGAALQIKRSPAFPFVRLLGKPDRQPDRLYFGKALIYPLFAAPFVRFFGLNGFLLFHVLLLGIVALCGYAFLVRRSSSAAAALFTTAFLGASVVPLYSVFLTSEILNFTLVFVAYFAWLYGEASPARTSGRWWRPLAAAVLLGFATYSKLFNAGLIVPLVLLAWWRREWTRGLVIGAVFVASTLVWFGVTAAVSGEFNYQGGDRRTFYGRFPFDAPGATWDNPSYGGSVSTDSSRVEGVVGQTEAPERFVRNVGYFLVGRHFGFVPYFFPGAVAIMLWLWSRERRHAARVLVFCTFVASALALVFLLPFTWSGGGGPPGNRYLLSVYPVLFFLAPPMTTTWAGVAAWMGGALFTAKLLLNPFVSAKYTYLSTERGPTRRLPVELTMVNDLPVMLSTEPIRARIPYGHDPTLLLYFLDQNAFPPDPPGMWVSGGGRADIIVRSADPIDHVVVSAESPIDTVLTVSLGAGNVRVPLTPGKTATFSVPAAGVRYVQSYAYLMSVRSSEGFIPHLQDPESKDFRNLGALLRFQAVTKPRQ